MVVQPVFTFRKDMEVEKERLSLTLKEEPGAVEETRNLSLLIAIRELRLILVAQLDGLQR